MFVFRNIQSETGIVGLIPLAVALPIIILVFAGMLHYAQIPVLREYVSESMQEAALRAEEFAIKSNRLVKPFDVYGAPAHALNVTDNRDYDDLPAFLKNKHLSASIANGACEALRNVFDTPSVMRSIAGLGGVFNSSSFSARYAVVEFHIVPGIDPGSNTREVKYSGADINCAGGGLEAQVLPNTIGENLLDKFSELYNVQRGGYAKIPYGQWGLMGNSAARAVGIGTNLPVDSYWLIGTFSAKVSPLFSTFFGGDKTITEYSIRPFNIIGGITSPYIEQDLSRRGSRKPKTEKDPVSTGGSQGGGAGEGEDPGPRR